MPTSAGLGYDRLTGIRLVALGRSMARRGTCVLADLLALPTNLTTALAIARSVTALLALVIAASKEFATWLTT